MNIRLRAKVWSDLNKLDEFDAKKVRVGEKEYILFISLKVNESSKL